MSKPWTAPSPDPRVAIAAGSPAHRVSRGRPGRGAELASASRGGMPLVVLLALAVSCSSSGDDGGGGDRPQGVDVGDGVIGSVQFLERTISAQGRLSSAADARLRPARRVRVEIVRADGTVLATTETDANGRFGVGGALPGGFQVLAYPESSGASDPQVPVRIVDSSGAAYAVSSPQQGPVREGERVVVDLIAGVSDDLRLGGAFHIVDTIQRAGSLWIDATGIVPNTAVVNWEAGVSPGTFFSPSSNRISLVGGVRGLLDSTDTDEFDDVVIAHEYMHFLVFNHAHSSSPGGRHSGEDLVPNLAFEEGFADWFGAFAQGESVYQDTTGNGDGAAGCLICDDLESSTLRRVEGIGSEQSVYEILWDLSDGFGDQGESTDDDGVGVDVSEMLRAIVDFDPDTEYSYLGGYLEDLVDRGAVSAADLEAVLDGPVDHDISFPLRDRESPSSGRDAFPVPLPIGRAIEGAVDASSTNVERGFDSIRYYEFEVATRRSVRVTLTITSSSAANCDVLGEFPCDVDLRLLTVQNLVLGTSDGTTDTEVIERVLDPGTYVVGVFGFFLNDQGASIPNVATYTLEVE